MYALFFSCWALSLSTACLAKCLRPTLSDRQQVALLGLKQKQWTRREKIGMRFALIVLKAWSGGKRPMRNPLLQWYSWGIVMEMQHTPTSLSHPMRIVYKFCLLQVLLPGVDHLLAKKFPKIFFSFHWISLSLVYFTHFGEKQEFPLIIFMFRL